MIGADGFHERISAIVGDAGLLRDSSTMDPYLRDWRGIYVGKARCVVRPKSTDEVARIVALCAELRIPVVPQGGNTGLVGGGTPDGSGDAVVLSLQRLNRIRNVDTANNTLTAEAGCVLAAVQQAAAGHDRLFPLSLAAEGSCTIGGNLSTNAGGTAVLRYGNMRDLVLGIEAVLPDGSVWNGLRGLRKDNTGYDLKQLLIGGEGTLGVITAAVLKLYPRPRTTVTALAALAAPAQAVALLGMIQREFGDRVTAFELIDRLGIDRVIQFFPQTIEPFAQRHQWHVLLELSDASAESGLAERALTTLESALEAGQVLDVVVAASGAQAAALWKIREDLPEAERLAGKNVKHDISLPISRIPEFIERCGAALHSRFANSIVVCFGHVGDGNLHYNVGIGEGARELPAEAPAINEIVYEFVDEFGGSISAEHGLGQLKRAEITRHKTAIELNAMRAIKHALDPLNIMNPGKVL